MRSEDTLLQIAIEEMNKEAQTLGLRPYLVVFDIVPPEIMFQLASYIVPGRFSHWSHGREYAKQKTHHRHGHGKLYETVLNTNTCQAYLADSNTLLENKMVAAHVLGHSDFFANNGFYAGSPPRMDLTMNAHANRIRQFEDLYEASTVEMLLDAILSIEHYVDPFTADYMPTEGYEIEPPKRPLRTPYDDLEVKLEVLGPRWTGHRIKRPYTPNEPDRDLLRFIMLHSPILDDWEKEVIGMIREESLYFAPNRRTKFANEGWATLIHSIIMRRMDLTTQEYVDFAKLTSGVTQPHEKGLNPYHVGYITLRYLNKKYGGDHETLAPEMLELREFIADASLMRDYLDEELVEELGFTLTDDQASKVTLKPDQKRWQWVRDNLMGYFYNSGLPEIVAIDGDYAGERELLLRHNWTGMALDIPYAQRVLEHIYHLWGRPVHLETPVQDDEEEFMIMTLSFDDEYGHTSD